MYRTFLAIIWMKKKELESNESMRGIRVITFNKKGWTLMTRGVNKMAPKLNKFHIDSKLRINH